MSKRSRASSLFGATVLSAIAPLMITVVAHAQNAAAVDVVAVVSRTVSQTRSITGELTPYESVAIFAKVNSFVRTVAVDRGSPVRKGQALAMLDAPEIESMRAEAQARLAAVRSQQAEAQSKLVALQNTAAGLKTASATPGAISTNELVQADQAASAQQAVVTSFDGQIAAAGAAVDAVRQQERYLQIEAPFDGTITERNVHPGAFVGPQAGSAALPLFRLENTRRLRLVVAVPEAALGVVEHGTSVEFTVPAHPGAVFRAPIARVAGSVDPKTRTMPVELDVTNADGRLAPGMYPSVRWPVRRDGASLLVPKTAVVTTTERVFVIRVRSGRTEWVNVTRGAATEGDLVEVLGPLQPGDDVVVRASDEIRAGQSVTARRSNR